MTFRSPSSAVDKERLEQFMGKVLSDLGGASEYYFSIRRRQTWIVQSYVRFWETNHITRAC